MRHLAVVVLASGCLMGSTRTRVITNSVLVAGGTAIAIGGGLDTCPMHPPGLLNFDGLCQGFQVGEITAGVAVALAGLVGLAVAANQRENK